MLRKYVSLFGIEYNGCFYVRGDKKCFACRQIYLDKNNASTMTCRLVDTVLFTVIAFYGLFPIKTIAELCVTTYIVKVIIAACDTPFLCLAKYIKKKIIIISGYVTKNYCQKIFTNSFQIFYKNIIFIKISIDKFFAIRYNTK